MTPPFFGLYTTDPPNPPVHQPCDEKLIMLPPCPSSFIAFAEERFKKKVTFKFVSI